MVAAICHFLSLWGNPGEDTPSSRPPLVTLSCTTEDPRSTTTEDRSGWLLAHRIICFLEHRETSELELGFPTQLYLPYIHLMIVSLSFSFSLLLLFGQKWSVERSLRPCCLLHLRRGQCCLLPSFLCTQAASSSSILRFSGLLARQSIRAAGSWLRDNTPPTTAQQSPRLELVVPGVHAAARGRHALLDLVQEAHCVHLG